MPLITYNEFPANTQKGGTIREDLQDYIANLAPAETPLFSGLEDVKVNAGLVEWLVDSFPPGAHNAMLEGIAFTEYNISLPARAAALTQLFYKSGSISDKQRAVAHAGFADPKTYAEFKALMGLKLDIEHALHRGSAVSGAAGVAPQFNGLLNSNLLSFTLMTGPNQTLTETIFNDILELIYQSGTARPAEVFCNSRVKRAISAFSTRNTFQVAAADRRQILTTDIYESDFGVSRVFLSREQLRGGVGSSANPFVDSWVAIDPQYFVKGWLSPVRQEDLPRDGLRDRFQLSAELTLICRNRAAGGGAIHTYGTG